MYCDVFTKCGRSKNPVRDSIPWVSKEPINCQICTTDNWIRAQFIADFSYHTYISSGFFWNAVLKINNIYFTYNINYIKQ